MSDVQAALDAMRAAEDEAREWLGDVELADPPERGALGSLVARWARDRLRLVERDRATLERHTAQPAWDGAESCARCSFTDPPTKTWHVMWPCDDAAAVIGYWLTEGQGT